MKGIKKLHGSTKIAIAFVVVVAGAYFGYQAYARASVMGLHFDPVKPGEVNLVGIAPGAGYKIIVANDMAQLCEASDNFGGKEDYSGDSSSDDSGAVKFRIPIREMLGAFRGDTKSVGDFVQIMNDMRENDKWPSVQVIWTAENLRKAFDQPGPLRDKLVRDLNMQLDGTPLPVLRPSSLSNGIIVDFPVAVTVNIEGQNREVVGRVLQPYQPRMMSRVEEKLQDTKMTDQAMAGYYGQAAKEALDHPQSRENIQANIERIISKENADQLRIAPERVLKHATVVANEHQIAKSSSESYDVSGKQFTDLTIELTDEGRKRLWKYSVDRVGTDLLLIVQGVAIAAPRIERPLTEQELTIKRMPDKVLAEDAVSRLNSATGKDS